MRGPLGVRRRVGREKERACLWLDFKGWKSLTFKALPLGPCSDWTESWNLSPTEGKVGILLFFVSLVLSNARYFQSILLNPISLVRGHILSSYTGRFAGCVNITPFLSVLISVMRRQSHPRIHLCVVEDGFSTTWQSQSCKEPTGLVIKFCIVVLAVSLICVTIRPSFSYPYYVGVMISAFHLPSDCDEKTKDLVQW